MHGISLYSPEDCEHIECVAQRLDQVLYQVASQASALKLETTAELESAAQALLRSNDLEAILLKVVSSITHRPYGFVGSYSINEELTHSPPRDRHIRSGDVLTIDIAARGTTPGGVFVADLSRCVPIGIELTSRAAKLCQVAVDVVEACKLRCKPGEKWSDVAAFAQKYVHDHGMCIAPDYNGHGVGRNLHEWPVVSFDTHRVEYDFVLQPGMVFTIEPIIIEETARPDIRELEDGWTVVESHGRWSAYHERMVIVR